MRHYSSNLRDEILNPQSFVKSPAAKLSIARSIAFLLEKMHQEGIAHMDLKPENILIDGNRAVLSDFGGCVIFNQGKISGRPLLNLFGATPEYAPWELLCVKTWDDFSPPAADVYAFGVILFYLFTEQLPHRTMTKEQIIFYQKSDGFITRVKEQMLDGDIKQLVLQCIAIDRGQRPAMKIVASKVIRATAK
jgi:serine/threonine protein kinase